MTAALVPFSHRKLVGLDGVRGLAIVAVMLAHVYSQPFPLPAAVRSALHFGWCGVDLFFALSGFLITGILLDSRQCTNYFRSFYARRFLRIFPLYYGFLFVALLAFPYIVPADLMPARSDRWLYVCYLANWQQLLHWSNHILGHFWSLCVEEQFYFLWPLVVLLVSPRRLLPFVVGLELALIVGRLGWLWTHGSAIATSPVAGVIRIDGLLLGAACALVVRQFRVPQTGIAALPWIAALFLSAVVAGIGLLGYEQREMFTESVGLAMLAISFAAIVLYVVLTDADSSWQQAAMRWKPLVLLGKYSYGIYVFHVPVFYFLDRLSLHLPNALNRSIWFSYALIALKFATAFGIASFSYNFFEKRFLALKDRFEPVYRVARSSKLSGEDANPSLAQPLTGMPNVE
jgi:peptidoglycan/LPS O-acetylase OafA/YrhL